MHAIEFWQVVQRREHGLGIGKLDLQCCCARDRFVLVSQWRHRHSALPPEMVVGGFLRDAVELTTHATHLVTVGIVLQYSHKRLTTQVIRTGTIFDKPTEIAPERLLRRK